MSNHKSLPSAIGAPVLRADGPDKVAGRTGGGVAPYEGKAIGEFANNSPPAAIANAVADAVGARLFELPISGEKIYHALKKISSTR